MPQIIPAIGAFFSGLAYSAGFGALNLAILSGGGLAASAYGAGLAIGGFVAAIGGLGTLLTVAAVGVSLLSQPELPKAATPSSQTQIVRTSVGYRRKAYGKLRCGGQLLFQGVKQNTSLFSADGNNMTMVIALADGPINGITNYYIDGEEVTVSGGNATSGKYANKVAFDVRLGEASQSTFADLLTDFSGDVDSSWTGNSVAMLLVRFLCTNDVYNMIPSGAFTEPTCVIEGSKLYDPRSGATTYSANSVLVLRDFLTSGPLQNGMNIPADLIDDDDSVYGFKAAANHCDVTVDAPGSTTRKRWESHGWVDYARGPASTLALILSSFDAKMIITENGKIGVAVGGVWIEPTLTLTDDEITSIKRSEGRFVQDRGTVIKSRYLSPDHGYLEQDAKEYQHPDFALFGRHVRSVDFIMAANHGQCRHLQKIAANRINSPINIEVQTLGYDRTLKSQRYIKVESGSGAYAINNTFEIEGEVKEVFDETGYCIGQAFAAVQMSQTDVIYDEATEGVDAPEVQGSPNNDLTPSTPTLGISTNGTVVTCTISNTTSTYFHTIRYREVLGGGNYGNYAYASLEAGVYVTDITIPDGSAYEFQVKAITVSQLESDYGPDPALSTSGQADSTPPAVCTSVDAATGPSAGELDVTFVTPSSANFSRANIYTNTTDNSSSATLQGSVSGANTAHNLRLTSLSADDYYVYVASANGSGVESARTAAASNPVTVT